MFIKPLAVLIGTPSSNGWVQPLTQAAVLHMPRSLSVLLHSPFQLRSPCSRFNSNTANLFTSSTSQLDSSHPIQMIPPVSFQITKDGAQLPGRGLGTFQPDPTKYPDKSVKQSVLTALKAGYRHIDTSLRYGDGQGEREVGEAIRESGVPREEIIVVTKLFVIIQPYDDIVLFGNTYANTQILFLKVRMSSTSQKMLKSIWTSA